MNGRQVSLSQTLPRASRFDRFALIGVTVLGLAACSPGVGRVAASGAWLSIAGVLGSLLGAVVLVVVGARLLGRSLPLVTTDRAAIVAVVAVGLAKALIALVAL